MYNLLVVGHGKMGGALLNRWMGAQLQDLGQITVIDPAVRTSESTQVRFFSSFSALPVTFKPDIVVFAVKPQSLDTLLPEYASRYREQPLYLSIAAGKTIAFFLQHMGPQARIIRAMPNTPAMLGEGITALCASKNVLSSEKNRVTQLFDHTGDTVWVDESQINAITAISGSGPAYIFLFMEALKDAALSAGLSEEIALRLVRQTVKGSALMAQTDDATILRKQVTSPGGTTEAAIAVLQTGGWDKLIKAAVAAAIKRAEAL